MSEKQRIQLELDKIIQSFNTSATGKTTWIANKVEDLDLLQKKLDVIAKYLRTENGGAV